LGEQEADFRGPNYFKRTRSRKIPLVLEEAEEMSPLIRPDEEPREEAKPNIDNEIQQKAENFWSVLRATIGKLGGGMNAARKSKILRQGIKAVWYTDQERKKNRK
jgi:hypothetical protein